MTQRSLGWRRVLFALMGLLLMPGDARTDEAIRVPLSDAQVLRMGYSHFAAWWKSRGQEEINDGEVSQDEGAQYYADLRRKANRRELSRFPPADRDRLQAAGNALETWVGEWIETERRYEGGGTGFDHSNARKDAPIEDRVAQCIREFRQRDPAPVEARFQRCRRRILRLQPKSDDLPEPQATPSYAGYLEERRDQIAAFDRLIRCLGTLPAHPRRLFLIEIERWIRDYA